MAACRFVSSIGCSLIRTGTLLKARNLLSAEERSSPVKYRVYKDDDRLSKSVKLGSGWPTQIPDMSMNYTFNIVLIVILAVHLLLYWIAHAPSGHPQRCCT